MPFVESRRACHSRGCYRPHSHPTFSIGAVDEGRSLFSDAAEAAVELSAGTFFGGPIGDRIGRKAVIWFSILGVAPFTLALPHLDLFWTGVLSMIIGFILASAFSAIVVFAQELVPGNVGMIAGLFFGLMFGFGGFGGALPGHLADIHGIEYVFLLCSYLPLLGILTILLPSTRGR